MYIHVYMILEERRGSRQTCEVIYTPPAAEYIMVLVLLFINLGIGHYTKLLGFTGK